MINFLRNTVRIAFALPIALSFAIGAAQADKIKIALAETPSDELAAFFVALDRARANGLDYEWTAFSDEELSNPLRIQWLDLKAPVEDLNITLKDNISFFNAAIAQETSGTGSDHKAYTVAQFVAAVFLKIDRTVP